MSENEEILKLLQNIDKNGLAFREILDGNLTHITRAVRFVEDIKKGQRVDYVELCEVLEDLRADMCRVAENRIELVDLLRQSL